MTKMNEKNNGTGFDEAAAAAFLDSAVKNHDAILIDTCSLMNKEIFNFMNHIAPCLENYDKQIVVPTAVIKELMANLKNPEKAEKHGHIEAVLRMLRGDRMSPAGTRRYFLFLGSESEDFADPVFLNLMIAHRMERRMLFITQDRSLAADIMNQNGTQSVKGNNATVKMISREGYLTNLNIVLQNGRWSAVNRKKVSVDGLFGAQSGSRFILRDAVTDMADEPVSVSSLPGECDVVYAFNPKDNTYADVRLGEMIASGGEGCVYETDCKFVAKIYKEGKLTARRQEKIMLMTGKELSWPGICFPVLPLVNTEGELVGYLMKQATGRELGRSVFSPYIRHVHPDWTRKDLVQLCVTILKKMEYLHAMGILMGDINPANILVASPTEVHFVDTDSYQIEDLPCPVGQCIYTAPEIQGQEYSTFLRTMGNENFAVATLLFQILLPGKSPYSHAGNGTQNENIREMRFPYRLGDKSDRSEPEGAWRYMWSHLLYAVKEAFYTTFQKGECHAEEETRLSSSDWLKLMRRYQYALEKGGITKNDPMSGDIFPTRFKAGAGASWAVCEKCGEPFPYYDSEKKKHKTPPRFCGKCMDEVVDYYTCADCGEEVALRGREMLYVDKDKFVMPIRCPDCRRKRQAERVAAQKIKAYGGLVFSDRKFELPNIKHQ